MNQYKKLDIVLIPFPFTDIKNQKLRPALLISIPLEGVNHGIFAMITSSKKQTWQFDIELENIDFLSQSNCILRLGKVFTLDLRLAKKVIGNLQGFDNYKKQIKTNLTKLFEIERD